MQFGNGLHLRSTVRSNPLGVNHPVILSTWVKGASLRVGENFAMTGGTICCAESITIGDYVALGANSMVVDTDFHPLTPQARRVDSSAGKTAPVIIEDEVFIGMNCLILKGVSIGQGSVIGANSVVTRDVPPGSIAAGNPARVVRQLSGADVI
jgi:acetyltransferase-like isoleucine patch superfamily enzyme